VHCACRHNDSVEEGESGWNGTQEHRQDWGCGSEAHVVPGRLASLCGLLCCSWLTICNRWGPQHAQHGAAGEENPGWNAHRVTPRDQRMQAGHAPAPERAAAPQNSAGHLPSYGRRLRLGVGDTPIPRDPITAFAVGVGAAVKCPQDGCLACLRQPCLAWSVTLPPGCTGPLYTPREHVRRSRRPGPRFHLPLRFTPDFCGGQP